MTSWKVPTPTDIRFNESIDLLAQLIFMYTLNLCQNKPYNKVYFHGNKRVDLSLDRGQCLFNVQQFAQNLKLPRSRIFKALLSLKWYTEMNIETNSYGTVITYLSYDDVVGMNTETYTESKSKANRKQNESKTKNKSDKSEENDKSEKNIINAQQFSISDFLEDFNIIRKHYLPNARNITIVEPKAKRQLSELVKQGIKREDMQVALKALFADQYHTETRWKYCTPEFITRSDKFARFSMTSEDQYKTQGQVGII